MRPHRSAPAGIHGPARREPSHRDRPSRGLLDACAPGQNDQVCKRDPLAAGAAPLNSLWMPSRIRALSQFGRLVDFPVLLGCKTDRAPFAPPRLSSHGRWMQTPRQSTPFGIRTVQKQDPALEGGNILLINQRVIDRGMGPAR